MMKVPKRNLGDKLHRAWVWACMGLTAAGAVHIAFRGFEYILYVRPIRKAEEARIEQQLLMEGQGFSNPAPQ